MIWYVYWSKIVIIPLDFCFSHCFSFFHSDLVLWSSRQAASLGPLKRIFIKTLFPQFIVLSSCSGDSGWILSSSQHLMSCHHFLKEPYNRKHFDIFFSHEVTSKLYSLNVYVTKWWVKFKLSLPPQPCVAVKALLCWFYF